MAVPAPGEQDGGIMEKIEKIFSFPDQFTDPVANKVARVVLDLGIIGLGVGVLALVTGGFNPASVANPATMMVLTVFPLSICAAGLGLAWLMEDLIPGQHHRTASKVMTLLMPALMLASSLCIVGASFSSGIYATSFNSYSLLGMMMVPLTLSGIGVAINALGRREVEIISRRALRLDAPLPPYIPSPPGITVEDRDLPPNPFFDDDL
jgi:hypothetical protein